ncbi:MAG: hypothetical protein AAFY03_04635 [Pseudomonadota bacterium]
MPPQPSTSGPSGEDQARASKTRQIYRRSRLMDAARLMPLFGVALVLLPVLWATSEGGARTSSGVVYLFLIWFGLIALAAHLARRLAAPLRQQDGRGE